MQDKAITALGEWQLKENKDLEPVDLYIENMFTDKDYQILLIVFEINDNEGELHCNYKGIDIEKVSSEKEDNRKRKEGNIYNFLHKECFHEILFKRVYQFRFME